MRFWDASAIVPLLVEQGASERCGELLGQDGELVVWWGTAVECWSALARLRRDGRLSEEDAQAAGDLLAVMRDGWNEVEPAEPVREQARRLLGLYLLRAADALQLAAAMVVTSARLELPFVTLDDRLGAAAAEEGFAVIP